MWHSIGEKADIAIRLTAVIAETCQISSFIGINQEMMTILLLFLILIIKNLFQYLICLWNRQIYFY